MKIRQGGVWVDANAYIRQNNQWVYTSFLKNADEFLLVISQTTTDLNLQTAFNNTFGSTAWISSKRKRVVINSGVIVGATSSTNNALTIPTGLGGNLTIENLGSILGAGGAANGGTGGNAILANSPVSINNQGSIYAGGGGGGRGGDGGQGGGTVTQSLGTATIIYGGLGGDCNIACATVFGSGAVCSVPNPITLFDVSACYFNIPTPNSITVTCTTCSRTTTTITSGGAGGSGGIGQGFNQSLTSGSLGLAGGTGAGTGGNGGAGGNWGASGSAGTAGSNGTLTVGSPGSPGGLSGFYAVNEGNINWINKGDVAGRDI